MQLNNLPIGRRLTLAFATVLLLVAAAAAVAIVEVEGTQTAAQAIVKYFPIIRAEEALGESVRDEHVLLSRLFMGADGAATTQIQNALTQASAAGDAAVQTLDQLVKSTVGRQQLADMRTARGTFLQARDQVLAQFRGGDAAAARQTFDGAYVAATEAYESKLSAFTATQIQHADKKTQHALDVAELAQITLLGGTLIALLVAVAVGLAITRSITRPLAHATRAARAIAAGDLSVDTRSTRRDEAGVLLDAMQTMRNSLNALIGAQTAMYDAHAAGQIGHRIAAGEFPGAYGRMAANVNALVDAHLGLMRRVIEIVQRYADGDFSARMDTLPGEQAAITTAIAGVKASFEAMSEEIVGLVEAAARGDFSARGDAQAYKHRFRDMIEGLNRLMTLADAGLKDVATALAEIARGNLGARIEAEYAGTFGTLKDSTNRTAEELAMLVGEIRSTADAIGVAARQIASGNSDLSARTERQAANLEETASSMEEIDGTAGRNADSTAQANQLVQGAAEIAVRSGGVVQDAVQRMEAISEHSRRIAEIIGVIDGIAFQTNILALNAAVEAARAGEQGRGFAVVASEVRSLAQRSAESSKEIRSLITSSVEQISDGAELVRRAGTSMDDIVTAIKKATDTMNEIAAATREQNAGINQVTRSITDMDEATQQNAALVEEVAAASHALDERAATLVQMIGRFRLQERKPGTAQRAVA